MHYLGYYLRGLIEGLLLPLDYLPRWLGLSLVSVVTGIVIVWIIGKTTPQRLVVRARDQMAAALLETRLYLDYPSRVLGCQARMVGWSLVYVVALLPSFVVMAAPVGLVFLHLNARYSVLPLPPNEPTVLQVDLADGVDGAAVKIDSLSDGLRVTGPLVYARDTHQVFARLEIDKAAEHAVLIQAGDRELPHQVQAQANAELIWPRRDSGLQTLWSEGWSAPLPDSALATAIVIDYPSHTPHYLKLPWWLYWMVVATIAAFAFRRRLGVAL